MTELASNVLKHAQHGSVILEPLRENGATGLRILGLDKGPGIQDLSRALEGGYSTAGTAGHGLGAIQRLSDAFEVFSSATVRLKLA
jgi:anti-sigma regulatory factor (Ser/Thr protein kinase)